MKTASELLDHLCNHVASGGRVIIASHVKAEVGDVLCDGVFSGDERLSVLQYVKVIATREEWLRERAAWPEFDASLQRPYYYEIEVRD